jgi:hypothetical protein
MDSVVGSSQAVQPSPAAPTSTISVRPKEDLWEKALQSLKDGDKRNIRFEQRDKLEILKDILEALEVKKAASVKNRWVKSCIIFPSFYQMCHLLHRHSSLLPDYTKIKRRC